MTTEPQHYRKASPTALLPQPLAGVHHLGWFIQLGAATSLLLQVVEFVVRYVPNTDTDRLFNTDPPTPEQFLSRLSRVSLASMFFTVLLLMFTWYVGSRIGRSRRASWWIWSYLTLEVARNAVIFSWGKDVIKVNYLGVSVDPPLGGLGADIVLAPPFIAWVLVPIALMMWPRFRRSINVVNPSQEFQRDTVAVWLALSGAANAVGWCGLVFVVARYAAGPFPEYLAAVSTSYIVWSILLAATGVRSLVRRDVVLPTKPLIFVAVSGGILGIGPIGLLLYATLTQFPNLPHWFGVIREPVAVFGVVLPLVVFLHLLLYLSGRRAATPSQSVETQPQTSSLGSASAMMPLGWLVLVAGALRFLSIPASSIIFTAEWELGGVGPVFVTNGWKTITYSVLFGMLQVWTGIEIVRQSHRRHFALRMYGILGTLLVVFGWIWWWHSVKLPPDVTPRLFQMLVSYLPQTFLFGVMLISFLPVMALFLVWLGRREEKYLANASRPK